MFSLLLNHLLSTEVSDICPGKNEYTAEYNSNTYILDRGETECLKGSFAFGVEPGKHFKARYFFKSSSGSTNIQEATDPFMIVSDPHSIAFIAISLLSGYGSVTIQCQCLNGYDDSEGATQRDDIVFRPH